MESSKIALLVDRLLVSTSHSALTSLSLIQCRALSRCALPGIACAALYHLLLTLRAVSSPLSVCALAALFTSRSVCARHCGIQLRCRLSLDVSICVLLCERVSLRAAVVVVEPSPCPRHCSLRCVRATGSGGSSATAPRSRQHELGAHVAASRCGNMHDGRRTGRRRVDIASRVAPTAAVALTGTASSTTNGVAVTTAGPRASNRCGSALV